MKISKKQSISLIIIFVLSCLTINAQGIEERILKVGTQDGVGPINMHGFYGRILGQVYLSDSENPDIFIQSDHWAPGFFLYKYKGRSSSGVPIFGEKISVILPYVITKVNYPGSVIQTTDGDIHLIWYRDQMMHRALFDSNTNTFVEKNSVAAPRTSFEPTRILASFDGKETKIVAEIPSSRMIHPPGDWREDDFIPYTQSGIWRGKINKVGLYEFVFPGLLEGEATDTKQLSQTDSEVYMSYSSISKIDLRDNKSDDLIVGSYMGVLYYYKRDKGAAGCEKRVHIVDHTGNAIRHPGISATPIAYPNSEGKLCDIIATCEGGMYFYKFTGNFTQLGKPIYELPVEVLETNANLHGGSLPVPIIVDFDGDGVLDLVVGNSQGFINFFKNRGSNENPSFLPGDPIKANSKIIQIQPGYGESVQGPVESRWGYVGPNVVDWDGDGNLDILTNDSRGKHTLYKGTSSYDDYRFKQGVPLFCRDLDLKGTWRCRPGVGLWDGKMSYITMDDDDEFHLYRRIDDQNLEDVGKLKMTDGSNIKGTYQFSGGTGRIRFEIVDWDGDGIKDLILGVCKWHSIPNPINGLPHKDPNGNPQAGALFMKNVGTEANPRFNFPEPISYKGKIIKMGGHEAGVATGFLGKTENGKPNLLMVNEQGRFFLFGHDEVNLVCDIAEGLPGRFIDKTSSSASDAFFSSTSIAKMDDGTLFASYYLNSRTFKVIIQKSINGGASWTKTAELDYGRNGSLFVVDNQLYLVGSGNGAESCVILKSTDGINWTTPLSATNGILMLSTVSNRVETTSTPVYEYNGRLFKSIQRIDQNGKRSVAFMSASKSANLLLRTSWTYSNYLEADSFIAESDGLMWCDMNIVHTSGGRISGLVSLKGGDGNSVAKINLSSDFKTATFDSSVGKITMSGGSKKFTLRYDATSNKYWAITSSSLGKIAGVSPDKIYNKLVLMSSTDLRSWNVERYIIANNEYKNNGILYTDWLFNDNNIVSVSCASWEDCQGVVSDIEEPNYVVSLNVENVK